MSRLHSNSTPQSSPKTPLPFKALAAFEAVARLGSITEAAEELAVTPSAISHQIKALQSMLGVKLLAATRGGALLTADGERFANDLSPSMAAIRDAFERVTPDRAFVLEVKPLLRMALKIGDQDLPLPVEGLVARIVSRLAGADLGAADAALRLGAHAAPGTTALSLGDLPVTLFAARMLSGATLPDATLLVSNDWPEAEDIVHKALATPLHVRAYEALSDVVLACQNAEGVALLPIALVRTQIRSGVLGPRTLPGVVFPPCPVTLHVRPTASSMRRAKALAAAWRRQISDLATNSPI